MAVCEICVTKIQIYLHIWNEWFLKMSFPISDCSPTFVHEGLRVTACSLYRLVIIGHLEHVFNSY